jgi:multisubunit Na+/H+ antiporter MnhG subunit
MKKRILAIGAIVILVGLYIACLVLALIHSEAAFKLLQLTLVMTVLVPVTAYVVMMFYKLNHRDDDFDENK